MNVIPVIDLLNGQVVHARHGNRQDYRPITSALCDGSEPMAMVAALQRLYPFTQLYIADLDAIQGVGQHDAIIAAISQQYPRLQIWLDSGFNSVHAIEQWRTQNVLPVLGTESLVDMAHYHQLAEACGQHYVLSLDFKAGLYVGPVELLTASSDWPEQVICMTLNQVGSNTGADWQQLQQLQALASKQALYAAGGIRGMEDLQRLAGMGIGGALLATALHSSAISGQQLARLNPTIR